MAAFLDLMRPLRRLADCGLARFCAHLPCPWEWIEESIVRRMNELYCLCEEKEALKKRAEPRVMGHRYESLHANGRQELRLSDWVEMSCGYC